jgi:hypothetical protein
MNRDDEQRSGRKISRTGRIISGRVSISGTSAPMRIQATVSLAARATPSPTTLYSAGGTSLYLQRAESLINLSRMNCHRPLGKRAQ